MPYKDKEKRNQHDKTYRAEWFKSETNRQKSRNYQNRWKKKQRLKVYRHYSNGTMSCSKCGITDDRVLTIDHINGGGRTQFLKTHMNLPQWIINNNYPKGMFQILCFNCQFIKASENKEWTQKGSGMCSN